MFQQSMQLHEAGYTRDDPDAVKDIPNIGQTIAPCIPKLETLYLWDNIYFL